MDTTTTTKGSECHHVEHTNSKDVEKNPQNIQVTASEESRVRRAVSTIITNSDSTDSTDQIQFDRRVMPIVCILYVLSYLDRGMTLALTRHCHGAEYVAGNIGNAKTAGLQKDLGLDSSQWAWVLNAFYLCYVLFEWTTVFWKLFPAHIYVAVLCVWYVLSPLIPYKS